MQIQNTNFAEVEIILFCNAEDNRGSMKVSFDEEVKISESVLLAKNLFYASFWNFL